MPLTIGATPFAQWACMQELMQHLGWHSDQPVQSGAELGTSDDRGPWILLHTRPEHAIAHALDQGQDPDEVLHSWRKEAQQVLNFFRANRRQAAMVDVCAAAQFPGELIDWLVQHHSAFNGLARPYSGVIEQPARPSELSLLLATQLVSQTPDLSPFLAHLEAGSVPFSEYRYGAPNIDINGVNEQLANAIDGPHSEQESLRRTLDEHQQRLAELQTARAQTEESLKNENQRLISQLHKVQEELEAHHHKDQDGSKSNEELKATLSAQESERKRRAEAVEKDLKEENDLVLAQLFRVQEELEKYYLRAKEQEKRLENQRVKSKKQNDEIAKRGRGIERRNDEIAKLENDLNTSKEELKSLRDEKKREREKLQRKNVQFERKIAELEAEVLRLKQDKRLLTSSLKQRAGTQGGFTLKRLVTPIKSLSRASRRERRNAELVRESELFDEAWYVAQNPDVDAQSADPALHYVVHGGPEGRAASPRFDSASYLRKNPDVYEQGLNPLVHYLLHGKTEGREI